MTGSLKSFAAIVLAYAVLIGPPRAVAGSILLTPKDANLLTQQEELGNMLGMVGMLVGTDPGRSLSWSGTITDSGWTLTTSTPYRDGVLGMSFTGALNSSTNEDSWNGTTVFSNPSGSLTFSSSGTYTNARGDGDWLDVVKIVAIGVVTVAANTAIVGVQTAGTVSTGGTVGPAAVVASATGITAITTAAVAAIVLVDKDVTGKVDLKNTQSSANPPFKDPFPLPFPNPQGLPAPPIAVTGTGQLSGNYANAMVLDSGFVNVSTIPEPSSVVLFGLGLAGTLGYGRWRKRRQREPGKRESCHPASSLGSFGP